MNNALRHTALTLAAASALLVLVALPSAPASPQAGAALPDAVAATALGLSSTGAPGLAAKASATEAPKRVIRKSARHRRQTLVMPFFSFAQRG